MATLMLGFELEVKSNDTFIDYLKELANKLKLAFSKSTLFFKGDYHEYGTRNS
ncbi:hypothetical protein [Kamptonema animale]|uniref:hypothetical protein n=1 Tax=Kamptonema animale TaxID=92934 RepID=UPI00232F15E7|nr:hypothetical protein [Kamptonema animale]